MVCSCLNCKDRHIGCHSECEKYIAFKKEHDTIKEKINHEKKLISDYYGMKERKYNKLKRR